MSSEVKANKISPATGTGVTLGDSGDTFTIPSGATIANSGTATGFGLFSSYAIIADQKSSTTNGGTATSGDWRERDLQTEIADPDGIVSISSNQFTLAAGSYFIRWNVPCWQLSQSQSRLYNVTDASQVAIGQSSYGAGSQENIYTVGAARVTITGSKAFSIEHYPSTTQASYGFGIAANITTEQYTTVEIFKEA